MAGLKLNHLYKVYPNGVKAVNDFTMDIKDKEFIVFVGPSGCGKSTTLRMIAGLEEISAGELKIGDRVVNDVEPKDRDIAMVFQNYALYPHMTVYQNMTFGLKLRKTKDIKRDKEGNPVLDSDGNEIPIMRHYTRKEMDEKVRAAAEILGITDYLDRKPAAMSGGQRQRVALGRAIVREPKVFLLDEPLSNLDAKLRTQMRSEISKLHQKLQTTFIYVTHDQVEAMTMGSRIVVMKAGFVQQIDKPRNLYDYPVNKFVAGFIGTPQMNFFNGWLKKDGDKVKVTFEWEKVVGREEVRPEKEDGEVTYNDITEKRSFALDAAANLFLKTDKRYLYGILPVTFGIRPEHVSINPEAYPYKGKARVTFVEELGTESLIYADIDVADEEITVDSPSKIIIKAAAGTRYDEGEVIDISYDLSRLHIFDRESEVTVSPRIPETSYMTCGVKGNKICAMGAEIAVPAFAGDIPDGNYILAVPTKAIKIGGNIKASVIKEENVEGERLVYLKAGENIIFAVDNENEINGEVTLSLDMKQLSLSDLEGHTVLAALPAENSLLATMVKYKKSVQVAREGKPDKTISVPAYDFLCGGVRFACEDEMAQSIINGTELKLCSLEMDLRFSPYDITLSDSGIEAEVESIIDYGGEKFAKCLVGDRTVYLSVPVGFAESRVKFAINTSALMVIDTYSDVRLV